MVGVGTPYRLYAAQVKTCPVVPAPIRGGDPGFLYEKARTQRVPGRGEFPPSLDPPLSTLRKLREVGFSFSYNLNTDARNGPPPQLGGLGGVGWWTEGKDREKSSQKIFSQKKVSKSGPIHRSR